jgi:hypothetical protein
MNCTFLPITPRQAIDGIVVILSFMLRFGEMWMVVILSHEPRSRG